MQIGFECFSGRMREKPFGGLCNAPLKKICTVTVSDLGLLYGGGGITLCLASRCLVSNIVIKRLFFFPDCITATLSCLKVFSLTHEVKFWSASNLISVLQSFGWLSSTAEQREPVRLLKSVRVCVPGWERCERRPAWKIKLDVSRTHMQTHKHTHTKRDLAQSRVSSP